MRVFFPLRRLASAGDDHAGAILGPSRFHLDRGRQVHRESHRANNAAGVMHEPHKLPDVGPGDQVDRAVHARMIMPRFAALHKLDSAGEMVDDALITRRVPPLGRKVVFAAGDQDPEVLLPVDCIFLDLAYPRLFET